MVTGNGTGAESVAITLPNGTGMNMEINVGCGVAGIAIVDDQSIPVVEFAAVPLIGDSGFCGNTAGGFGVAFKADPGRDFRSK